MFNRSILMGRICNELELKTTPSGKSVTTFRVAVERTFCSKDGERKVDFFNVCVWGKRAEFVCKFFKKGSMIMLEGERQQRKYTDKDGNPAIWDEIVADIISFTGETAQTNENQSQDTSSEEPYNPPDFTDSSDDGLDDYPF